MSSSKKSKDTHVSNERSKVKSKDTHVSNERSKDTHVSGESWRELGHPPLGIFPASTKIPIGIALLRTSPTLCHDPGPTNVVSCSWADYHPCMSRHAWGKLAVKTMIHLIYSADKWRMMKNIQPFRWLDREKRNPKKNIFVSFHY